MIIRKATVDDIPHIVPMWCEMTDEHSAMSPIFAPVADAPAKFAKYLEGVLNKENFYMPVAVIDGQIAGYVMASHGYMPDVFVMRSKVSLQDMMVKKEYRRMGVGKALVNAVRQFAEERKADRVDLQVAVKNESGFAFWKAVGFEPVLTHMTIARP